MITGDAIVAPCCGEGGTGVGVSRPREAKVQDLHLAVVQQEDVLGLQVAMDDPLVVRRGKTASHLDRALRRLADRERPPRQPLAQRLAVEQFRDGVGEPVVHAEVEDRQDVRVRQRGDGFRFALEPRQAVGVLRKRGWKHLDCDLPIEASVPGLVDLAHTAGTERREDFVRAEP